MSVSVRTGPAATVGAKHRDAICCKLHMDRDYDLTWQPKEDQTEEMRPWRWKCSKCGGLEGSLIARSVSIQPPPQPTCTKPKCLWQFFVDTVYSSLLSTYHCRRVRYAEEKRHKTIPMKYRTGEDAPKNIKRAILAIIILRLRR